MYARDCNLLRSVRLIFSKEFFFGSFFLVFILGINLGISYQSYNDFRVVQIILLLSLCLRSLFQQQYSITKIEITFLFYITIGSLFWTNSSFIVVDIMLVYLLFKAFQTLSYRNSITKLIVLSSLTMFLLLPLAIWDYINTGTYLPNWYLFSLNIRVYDSYFLIISTLSVWLYSTKEKYKSLYLLLPFLAFLAVLLDGGRSVTLAYTVFIAIVTICHKSIRLPLIGSYIGSWLSYLLVTYVATLGSSSLRIARESSSGRVDLWVNGLQCWAQNPIIGCGFYQLEQYPHLSAHPHNIFVQVLTETGLIGFSFLGFVLFKIARHISWNIKQNYFVIAALLAVIIDMSLSGVHIYPITQMTLLWLFVFLLKNPVFAHAQYFNQPAKNISKIERYLPGLVVLGLVIIFCYIFINASIFLDDMSSTPPRFWVYGYQLFR
ncbi:O-antigen ligase family protein [Psychrobacter submarinus]|uniref:O-antigen ligase family protein n=1 Tax=Psychrobacter submarinus TaxID=154108 RepID=UPI00191B0978|nr:O-antigen ligase family protein [Psychrobacter submarinus]